jgi:hypothetical protein
MNRFANNQASFGNKTASDAMTALFNETKNSATYDADMRTKKVLDTMFPSTSASSAQAGQSTYEQIGSMIQNLREDLTKLGALYLQPSSGLAPVIRAFLQSNSNELNAESLGALRAYVAIKAPPPGLAAGRVEEFNKAIDATAAQRGFSYNPATMSYKS